MDWSRAELTLERFENSSVTQLQALQSSQRLVTSLRRDGAFDEVSKEETKARRWLSELTTSLGRVMAVREHLSPVDAVRFEKRIAPISKRILDAARSLSPSDQASMPTCTVNAMAEDDKKPSRGFFDDLDDSWASTSDDYFAAADYRNNEQTQIQMTDLKLIAEQKRQEAEMHAKLGQDIVELQSIMNNLAELVHDQHEVVDSIEANIESTQTQIHQGERNLKKSAKYNAAKYPLVGGVIGAAALGGPVGLAVGGGLGLVAGICSAVGGAAAGIASGRALKRQAQQD